MNRTMNFINATAHLIVAILRAMAEFIYGIFIQGPIDGLKSFGQGLLEFMEIVFDYTCIAIGFVYRISVILFFPVATVTGLIYIFN